MAVDVWGDLLRGARARHAFTSKTLVVLGEPSSGKEALLERVARCPCAPPASSAPLHFGFVELGEHERGDERVGVYTVHAADASVHATLPYAFPPVQTTDAAVVGALRRMREALFVVALDAAKPWSVVAQLQAYIRLIRSLVQQGHALGCAHDAEKERADLKTRVEEWVLGRARAGDDDETVRESSSARVKLGTLSDNLGVRLAIVLTNADALDAAVRERRLTETQVDVMQQVIRTVAMQYGAAVFATSERASFEAVRQYMRAALYDARVDVDVHALETPRLCIPPGWDSWSKIEALHEPFACAAWHDAWQAAMAGAPACAHMYEQVIAWPAGGGDAARDDVPVPAERAFLAELQESAGDEAAPPAPAGPVQNAVGPAMHASTLDMPSVGRVLDEQQRPAVPAQGATRAPAVPGAGTPSRAVDDARTPSLTTPKQTEVLHSFFQSRTYARLTQCSKSRRVRRRPARRLRACVRGGGATIRSR